MGRDYVIVCEKALRSPMRNRELHRTTDGELLRGGRSARSALAEKTGSGKNRHYKPDSHHLGLDPVTYALFTWYRAQYQ